MSRVRAICALAITVAVAFGAIPSAASTGGVPVTPPGVATLRMDPGVPLIAGRSTALRGFTAASGVDVFIQIQSRDGGPWADAARTVSGLGGAFTVNWIPGAPGLYAARASLGPASGQASAPAPDTGTSLIVYRLERATWYGPNLYGRRTACGQRLTRKLVGVAHRTLPCGSRVALALGGRRIVARVVDRGPFVKGITWDVTAAAARRLDMRSTVQIAAAPLSRR